MVGSEQEREERQPLLADDTTSTYGANGQNGTGSKLPQSHESDVEAPTERNLAEQASSGTWEKVKYILPALAVGLFLSALDGSIIFANHAKIATDFNRLDLASWISTAFFLAMSSCQPLYGKLSDIFGRKACIIWAFCVFAIGNLFCGLAPNMESFIAARIVQGCGGAGVGTLTTVLISDVIPLRERAPWQGYLNLINAAGLAVGAPIGGLVADTIGWRWTFLCQVPFTLLAIASVVFFLRLGQRDTENWRSKLRRVDFLGALLLIATAVCLLLGLDRGSNVSWRAPIAFVPLAMFPVLFAVFVVVESKFAVEPFTPGHIILDRTVLSVYASSFFNYGGWGALMFYAPLFYQAVDGVSSSQAGLRLLPSIISAVCGTLIGGFILKRTGKYYWLMVTATGNATLAVLFVILGTIYVKFDVLCISIGMSVNSILTGFFVVGSLIALSKSYVTLSKSSFTDNCSI